MSLLDRERTVAPRGYNRWLIPPAALAVHLSIGEIYAFSVFKVPLKDHFGTGLTAIGIIFSIAIGMLGLSAAFGGRWVERAGPRKAMALAATCWGSGFLIGAVGVATTQLWIVYMGIGGGAIIASPLENSLLTRFGAGPDDGIVGAFIVLGCIYFVMMMLGAMAVRVPPEGWRPEGWTPPERSARSMITSASVTATTAIKTPQFWLLWTVLFCNVTAGIGILEQAAPLIQDFFPSVTAAAAAGFVGLLSICNMSGRFVWSSTSDAVGRKPIYIGYLGIGAICYFLLATAGTASVAIFVLLTGIILSFYGGGFATVPAYLKDLFGTIEVGAVHGRLLTAWSAAGIAGPLIVNGLADHETSVGKSGADLYTISLFIMVGVLVVGFIANLMIRPVDGRFHETGREADRDERFVRDGRPATASSTPTTTMT